MTKKFVFLIILTAVIFILSSLFGAVRFSISDIIYNESIRDIWLNMRLARIVLGFLAGSGLALSGMAFQSLFRNPLAEPFTLGISGGATLGCVVCVTLGLGVYYSISFLPVFAFLGALISIFLVYFLSRINKSFSVKDMLLAGIGVNFFFSAFVLLLEYFGNEYNLAKIMHWTMGGLDIIGFGKIVQILPFYLIGIFIIFRFAGELNIISLGENIALTRGVSAEKVRKYIFFGTSLMIGSLCAVCGPIGFVGMICPHIIRQFFGWDCKKNSAANMLFGGMFLVLCDTAGRCIISPEELPVGIITSLLGGPFFIYLLCRKKV